MISTSQEHHGDHTEVLCRMGRAHSRFETMCRSTVSHESTAQLDEIQLPANVPPDDSREMVHSLVVIRHRELAV